MRDYTTNNLFAAEEWEVIFNAFRNISIQAFDYHTVHDALDNYIKVNNPEEYDYIKKNGIMSIHLDMISRLSHSLSYRYEMAARENFFDTATLRESVIKLAKAFSYRPKRNRVANGLCRIAAIRTTQPILDSDGEDISNQTVRWNHSGDQNWQDKFYRILNHGLTSTNQFGRPLKRENIYNIQHEIYAIERVNTGRATYSFNSPVNNTRISFEAISTEIESDLIVEETPNPNNKFKILYKNDRNGNFSINSGFFIQIKEGNLQSSNFTFNEVIPNRAIELQERNINETDLWVIEILDDNKHLVWDSVNNLSGQDVDYEKIFNRNTNLYTIESRDNNEVTVHFGDGVSTSIPNGRFRFWYRSSRNEYFNVKVKEIFEAPIQIPYVGDDGQTYQLTLFLTNVSEISNSEPEESVYRIKRNAPLAHYTQDRMVNAEDYNIFPQTRTSLIKKQKTVNRTHPGHSRYMDIYDSGNEISLVTINANDGYIFTDTTNVYKELNVTFTTNFETELDRIVREITKSESFLNYSYYSVINNPIIINETVKWNVLPNNAAGNRGYFTINGVIQSIGKNSNVDELKCIHPGTILKFSDGDTYIVNMESDGIVNPTIDTVANIVLGDNILDNSLLESVIPNVRLTLNDDEINDFILLMIGKHDFSIYYNFYDDQFSTTSNGLSIKLGDFKHTIDDDDYGKYDITIPSLNYIIGSNNDVRFFYKGQSKLLDPETLLTIQDNIIIEDGNSDPKSIKYTFLKRTNKSNDITRLPPL